MYRQFEFEFKTHLAIVTVCPIDLISRVYTGVSRKQKRVLFM